jgi:hypothetical protein
VTPKSLRAGLLTLATLQTIASVWQYFFPRSFYDDFPTVRLDPPYNEHLVSDVGGLGLALTAVLFFAAYVLERNVVLAALIGYLIYAGTHFLFHVRNFENFTFPEALGVGTGLGLEVVIAALLLYVTSRTGASRTGASRTGASRTGAFGNGAS